MGMEETAMRWGIFVLGALAFTFALWKKHGDGNGTQLLVLLGVPGGLMIVALFAPAVSSVELGPAKVNLKAEKAAAFNLVSSVPKVAEAITGKKGTAAQIEAVKKIEEAKRPEELQKILPYRTVNDAVIFLPTVEKGAIEAYKVPMQAASSQRIEKFGWLSPVEPGR